MNLKEQITADVKTAMKAGDSASLTVLRGLSSTLSNKAIEKRAKSGKDEALSDEEMLSALLSEAKKRKESITVFTQGGRTDLADNEAKELKIIEKYLPAQMPKEEVEKAVAAIISKQSVKEFGLCMKAVMAELRGKADSAHVTEAVKKQLG